MIHVLIVDDDKLTRKGLISMMPWSSHDMEVVGEVSNGAKALEFLQKNKVDLMFVDLAMPVISGIELIQETVKKYPQLYFVVLTCHEDFEYVQMALRLGALDYISKVRLDAENYESVLERIRQMIESQRHQLTDDSLLHNLQEDNISDPAPAEDAELCNEWLDLFWLYDESVFLRLCQKTKSYPRFSRHIKGALIRAIAKIEASTRFEVVFWHNLDDISSALDWVSQYREGVYQYADQSTDLSSLSICILKVILLIREEIASSLHAEETSSRVGMSRSYFSQCFKKFTGITFNAYVRQERMLLAAKLLLQPHLTVNHIAQTIGYEDVKYFSRLFKEHTGVLPSEYRGQHPQIIFPNDIPDHLSH